MCSTKMTSRSVEWKALPKDAKLALWENFHVLQPIKLAKRFPVKSTIDPWYLKHRNHLPKNIQTLINKPDPHLISRLNKYDLMQKLKTGTAEQKKLYRELVSAGKLVPPKMFIDPIKNENQIWSLNLHGTVVKNGGTAELRKWINLHEANLMNLNFLKRFKSWIKDPSTSLKSSRRRGVRINSAPVTTHIKRKAANLNNKVWN